MACDFDFAFPFWCWNIWDICFYFIFIKITLKFLWTEPCCTISTLHLLFCPFVSTKKLIKERISIPLLLEEKIFWWQISIPFCSCIWRHVTKRGWNINFIEALDHSYVMYINIPFQLHCPSHMFLVFQNSMLVPGLQTLRTSSLPVSTSDWPKHCSRVPFVLMHGASCSLLN